MWELPEELAVAVGIAPFAVGLTEVAKRSGLPTKWASVFDILVGIVVATLFALAGWAGMSWEEPAGVVLVGLAAGLMASGLYSGVKSAVGADEEIATHPPPPDPPPPEAMVSPPPPVP